MSHVHLFATNFETKATVPEPVFSNIKILNFLLGEAVLASTELGTAQPELVKSSCHFFRMTNLLEAVLKPCCKMALFA